MAGTFSQIYVQVVFSVMGRERLIAKHWREELFRYIAGIVSGKEQKAIAVGGVEDHVHILLGLRPSMRVSDLVRDIKSNSAKWVNQKGLVAGKFRWQDGYAVFSYSRSQLDAVYHYVKNQEKHHRGKSFEEEYKALLEEFGVEYDPRWLFD